MKTTLTIFATVFGLTIAVGQISTTSISSKTGTEEELDTSPYDSLSNFQGKNTAKYLGQELYLTPMSKNLRMYGYRDFVKDYKYKGYDRSENTYKCCDNYNSKYDDLSGKYFKVLEIIKHPKATENEHLYGSKSYLKLQEKTSRDIIYYLYDSQYENSFPFIIVGFYEKGKKRVIGMEFIFSDQVLGTSKDLVTGNPLTIKTGQKWVCTDLTIEEEYYSLSLIIQNPLSEKTSISYGSIFNQGAIKRSIFSPTEVDENKKKFGEENFNIILQGKIKIGMTKEMCTLSWGKPISVNETITAGKKSEQWVYSDKYHTDNYLYFDNGVLTAIQNR